MTSKVDSNPCNSEIYCYKVVYPHGAFIRVSPDLNAAKTGALLEFGTVFESSKSLFLDGINYVKLNDGRGWVFGCKGSTQVLDLIEVIRKDDKKNHVEYQSIDYVVKSRPSTLVRAQNMHWRELRSKASLCVTFAEFSAFCCDCNIARPPSIPEPGPARSAWMAESGNRDHQVRKCISLIASTTRKGAHAVSNIADLETLLWVLVHMGGQISHVMELVVTEANAHFEQHSPVRRAELLSVALEVGAATRAHSIELSKHADILADDIRNFIQRWVIIKAYKIDPEVYCSDDSPRTVTSKGSMELGVGSPHTVASVLSDDENPSSRRSTSTGSEDSRSAVHGGASSSARPQQGCQSHGFVRGDSTANPGKAMHNSSGRQATGLPVATGGWLSSWVCSTVSPNRIEQQMQSQPSSPPTSKASLTPPRQQQSSSSFLTDVEAYVRRLTTDPDFQFAGII